MLSVGTGYVTAPTKWKTEMKASVFGLSPTARIELKMGRPRSRAKIWHSALEAGSTRAALQIK